MGLLDDLEFLKKQRKPNLLANTRQLQRPAEPYLRQQYPEVYGALGGLLGMEPDEMAGSVLDPNTARVRAGAEYGFPVGTATQMLPMAKPAQAAAMAAGQASERLAERVVPRVMQRGGMGAEMLQGMSRGTVSPMQIFDTTGLPKKGVKLGNKVLPVIMHPIEAREGNVLANINPQAFDKAFKKTEWQYVGPQGQGGIGDRYNKFGEFAQTAPSMNASNVSVDKIGRITFGDGRHRYAYLRDQGVDSIPMSMDKESLANAKLHGLLNDGVQGPQSEALRLAQQRAALPPSKGGLGLPANNTPEQRAKAIEFNTNAYHATDADIIKFDNAKLGTNTRQNTGGDQEAVKSAMLGHWFSDRDLTNKDPRGYMFGDVVYPVKLRKPKKINDKEFGSTSYIVKDPDNIRSRFAAFDPFRRTAAIAATMGVAAPDLMAKEMDEDQIKRLKLLLGQ